jgi:hypothetical protein
MNRIPDIIAFIFRSPYKYSKYFFFRLCIHNLNDNPKGYDSLGDPPFWISYRILNPLLRYADYLSVVARAADIA